MIEQSYREAQRCCPGCGVPLAERMFEGVHVDVCPDCAGAWIDWMDGELASVAQKLDIPKVGQAGAAGDPCCPICSGALAAQAVLQGVEVLRCGSCAGAFLTRDAIVRLQQPTDAHHDDGTGSDPFLTRLLDAIGRLFGA